MNVMVLMVMVMIQYSSSFLTHLPTTSDLTGKSSCKGLHFSNRNVQQSPLLPGFTVHSFGYPWSTTIQKY